MNYLYVFKIEVMKYLVSLGYLLMVVVNYLANSLPINGLNTGQISANFNNLFTPASFAFSIWGVIYILLLIIVIKLFTTKNDSLLKAIGPVFIANMVLNSGWIFAWHYQLVFLSALITLGLLVTLIIINLRISGAGFRLTTIAFGIYLGWILVATIANFTVLFVSIDWNGWGISPQAWTVIMILAGFAIGIFAKYKLANPFILLPVAWAFLWIAVRRINDVQVIAIIAIIAMMVLLSYFVFYIVRQKGLLPTGKN